MIEQLNEDLKLLDQISELAANLTTAHQPLDDAVKELTSSISKQLADKQSNDSQLLTLELTVTSQ